MANTNIISPLWQQDVFQTVEGVVPYGDTGAVGTDYTGWVEFNDLINKSVTAGSLFSNVVVTSYSLVYTASNAYHGGVLGPDGSIHFVPLAATVGQKISPTGVVSTYSLVYTAATAYSGGVLAPDGSIHFSQLVAPVGQKVAPNGTVSTYSLVYTVNNGYSGGVLAPDGSIHFVPLQASVGQKINVMPALPLGLGACLDPYINKF